MIIEVAPDERGASEPMEEMLTPEIARVVMQMAARVLAGPTRSEGRGIVICAGGMKYFPCAWVCINMLRRTGCQLPIELWHRGPEEMSPEMRALVEPLGVQCIDAFEVRRRCPARTLNGWEIKPYAIIHSRFREVLLLDADNVPVINPDSLFDAPQFREHGAIFWPDFGRLAPDREIWDVAGVPYRDEPEFESGQILVDKVCCRDALGLTMWMNEHSDLWYRYIHGDKETFHIAWRKLGRSYAMPTRPIEALDGAMCQHDFEGRRIFQHRNMAKWTLGSKRRIEGFQLEEECLAFLDQLRKSWPLVESIAGGLTPEDRSMMSRLTGRRFRYVRVGHDERSIQFGDRGIIIEGAAHCEAYWWVRSRELVLAGQEGTITCRMSCGQDGAWQGQWTDHERMDVRLEEMSEIGRGRLHSLA